MIGNVNSGIFSIDGQNTGLNYYTIPFVKNGLVFYLDFNNPTCLVETNLVNDLSYNQNNFIRNNLIFNGRGLVFNGNSSDRIFRLTEIPLGKSFTISALVKKSNDQSGIIVGELSNGNDNWFSIYQNGLILFISEGPDTGNTFIISDFFQFIPNIYYYVTVTIENNEIFFYVNNKSISRKVTTINWAPWTTFKSIGNRSVFGSSVEAFSGVIDLVKLYDRALSPDEINFNYSKILNRDLI